MLILILATPIILAVIISIISTCTEPIQRQILSDEIPLTESIPIRGDSSDSSEEISSDESEDFLIKPRAIHSASNLFKNT